MVGWGTLVLGCRAIGEGAPGAAGCVPVGGRGEGSGEGGEERARWESDNTCGQSSYCSRIVFVRNPQQKAPAGGSAHPQSQIQIQSQIQTRRTAAGARPDDFRRLRLRCGAVERGRRAQVRWGSVCGCRWVVPGRDVSALLSRACPSLRYAARRSRGRRCRCRRRLLFVVRRRSLVVPAEEATVVAPDAGDVHSPVAPALKQQRHCLLLRSPGRI